MFGALFQKVAGNTNSDRDDWFCSQLYRHSSPPHLLCFKGGSARINAVTEDPARQGKYQHQHDRAVDDW